MGERLISRSYSRPGSNSTMVDGQQQQRVSTAAVTLMEEITLENYRRASATVVTMRMEITLETGDILNCTQWITWSSQIKQFETCLSCYLYLFNDFKTCFSIILSNWYIVKTNIAPSHNLQNGSITEFFINHLM